MPGTLGRFYIKRTLGSGASCKVKLADDGESGRQVAVKIMNDNMDAKMQELIMNEVRAMGELAAHPNVVQ